MGAVPPPVDGHVHHGKWPRVAVLYRAVLQRGYEHYTLGDATQQTLREIWRGPAYQAFRRALKSDKPPSTCANCGLRWSL